uniref:Putative secreted protein n=1 Tax=Anopheles darlingi TaxID=43151 RepID=A0A2M4DJX3_ANODA
MLSTDGVVVVAAAAAAEGDEGGDVDDVGSTSGCSDEATVVSSFRWPLPLVERFSASICGCCWSCCW